MIGETIARLLFHWRYRHDWTFNRNIYGDEINFRNGKRSEWICCMCRTYQYRDWLA